MEQDTPFRLLDLPPELWSRICILAVKGNGKISIDSIATRSQAQEKLRQPAITLTCKNIRAEVLPAFYADTAFIFHRRHDQYVNYIVDWITPIGPTNYSHIRDCEVRTSIKFSSQFNVEHAWQHLDHQFRNFELQLDVVEDDVSHVFKPLDHFREFGTQLDGVVHNVSHPFRLTWLDWPRVETNYRFQAAKLTTPPNYNFIPPSEHCYFRRPKVLSFAKQRDSRGQQ